jgi:pimeloyl-ACP methyl ester carboxylesterase
MRMLRDRGYKKLVLIGNSGGGSLLGYYQAQACRKPADRHTTSPAGDPTGFADEDMPPGDFYITLAAHQGEGRFLLLTLDPAVIDENDPIENDPDLDMFNPANGYRPWPEQSRYDPEWVARYREAQIERCRKLDTIAHSHLKTYRDAREAAIKVNDPHSAVSRLAVLTRFMVIYRTLASPAHLDLSITPNRRPMGSIFAAGHPMKGSYGPGGISRIMTPRAWLSTWSGLSSQAELTDTIREITVPTLILEADADTDIYPHQQQELLELSGAADKSHDVVEYAGHYLTVAPRKPDDMPHPREQAGTKIVAWLKERM